MELNLHANATTTPKTRGYIQRSRKSVAQLAAELGVCETTIRRWRGRTNVADRSHRPLNLMTSLSVVEERAVCELRTSLQLPLDDIVEVIQRCINAKLSRSAIHRCCRAAPSTVACSAMVSAGLPGLTNPRLACSKPPALGSSIST
jgi:transposase-like protein